MSQQCATVGARIREKLKENKLNVRQKPYDAPRHFIDPSSVKTILRTGTIEQIIHCPCDRCGEYSGCRVDERRSRYGKDELAELADEYAPIFALLLAEDCAGLIYDFQRNKITLHKRLYSDQLSFLEPILIERLKYKHRVNDVVGRILEHQFQYYAQPFEIGDVEREIQPEEALPIDEDEKPVGEGSSAEVFAFKILEGYKGKGFKDLKVISTQFHAAYQLISLESKICPQDL